MLIVLRKSPLILILLAITALTAPACSLEAWSKPERVASNFTVRVTHNGRPVRGVDVEIRRYGRSPDDPDVSRKYEAVFKEKTDGDGLVRVTSLPRGEFWLEATHLGVRAREAWIEVGGRRRAKHQFEFSWGDYKVDTRYLAGTLNIFVPRPNPKTMLDRFRGQEAPAASVTLSLQPMGADTITYATTDSSGFFTFGDLPTGTYVLRIVKGAKTDGYDGDGLYRIVDLSPDSQHDSLEMLVRLGGCGPELVHD